MKHTFGRSLAASIGALALIGVGVSSAGAAETDNPDFAFSPYIADANTAEPVTGTIGFEQQVVGLPDINDYMVTYPVPAGATQGWVFVSPRGMESTPSAWNAKSYIDVTGGAEVLMPNLSLTNQATVGGGNPNGINAVKAAGGEYSIGIAFTKDNGVNIVPNGPLYFGHITVTAGSGEWTYEPATKQVTASTTAVAVPSGTTQAGDAFDLTATVSPADATGTVEFFDGTTSLGSGTLTAGSATLNVTAGLSVGTHPLTAVYSGDSNYASSTSGIVNLQIAGLPVDTTVSAVSASSASGEGGKAVAYSATVGPIGATGSVTFTAIDTTDATHVIAIGSATPDATTGVAAVSTGNVPAGSWTIKASFEGTGLYNDSEGTAAAALVLTASSGLENPSDPDEQTVTVEVPKGAIEITTPYGPGSAALNLGTLKLDQGSSTYYLEAPQVFTDGTEAKSIQIINTRPDHHSWSAFVESTPFTNTTGAGTFLAEWMSLEDVEAVQVASNALQADEITETDIAALSSTAQEFATYAGNDLGTARLAANLDIHGVPSSTPSGIYSAVLTFTAY